MTYLRVPKTPLVRRTPLGNYLCFPYGFTLDSYYPILEIDEATEMLLTLCDGTHTREDVLQQLSKETGEPVEELADDVDQFITYLVNEGVLEWSKEPTFIEPIYKRDRPFSISIDITSACNLNCPFCSANSGTPRPDDLTLDNVIPFVEQVKKFKPTPFAISGGEPLLKEDILFYLLEELSPIKEIALSIFTNATLATKDYAQQLYDAGLRVARVSLDGHTEQLHDTSRGRKGAFKETIRGIENLKEVGIYVRTVTVISRINYQYLKEIREFVTQLVDHAGLVPVVPCGRAENSDLLLNAEERFAVKMVGREPGEIQGNVSPKNRCHIGETICITANGDVFPCLYMVFPEFRAGNIKENDFSEIYKSDVMQRCLKMTLEEVEQCRNCDVRYYCGGGCRGLAYGQCGSLYGEDPYKCGQTILACREILEHGEENTRQLLQELLEATKALG
jgi:radical SAM protein with 4Fe4S-binding SPASM domain